LPNCCRPIFLVLPKLYEWQVDLSNCWSCSDSSCAISNYIYPSDPLSIINFESRSGVCHRNSSHRWLDYSLRACMSVILAFEKSPIKNVILENRSNYLLN
jgi:hypothetical protein